MTTIVGPLSAITLILLVLQSILCLRTSQPASIRGLGVLTAVLAGVGLYGLVADDRLVVSREAGLLMTFGTAGWWLLAVFIVGVPVAGALAVSAGRAGDARARAGFIVGVSCIVGLVSARYAIAPLPDEPAVAVIYEFGYRSLPGAPWACLSAALFLVALIQSLGSRLQAVRSTPLPAAHRGLRYLLAVIGLAVLLVGIADALGLGDANRGINFIICAMGWLLLIEAACVAPLLTHVGQLDGAPAIGWISSLHAWFASATRSELALTSLMGIILVVLISEYPHKRHTIISTFRSPDSDAYKDAGRQMSDRLLYEIGVLQHELQPDMSALARDGASGGSAGATSGSSAEDTWAGTQELEFGGFRVPVRLLIAPIDGPIQSLLNVRVIEGSVEVGNTVGSDLQRDLAQTLQPTPTPAPRCTTQPGPAGTPVTPTPHSAEPEKPPTATPTPATPCVTPHDFVILASSSNGETWQAERTTCDAGTESWRSEYDAVRGLAFNILRADKAFAKDRFTDTYPAFQQFEEGLDEWRRFETERSEWDACAVRAVSDENKKCEKLERRWTDCRRAVQRWDACTAASDDADDDEHRNCTEPIRGNDCTTRPPCLDQQHLLSAVEDFRYAVDIDPAFALAYYRLGLALHETYHRDTLSRFAESDHGRWTAIDEFADQACTNAMAIDELADQACTDAIDALSKSREHDPQFADASLELASLLSEASSRSDECARRRPDPHKLCTGVFFSTARANHRAQAASELCNVEFPSLDRKDTTGHLRIFYCKELAYLSAGALGPNDSPALRQ